MRDHRVFEEPSGRVAVMPASGPPSGTRDVEGVWTSGLPFPDEMDSFEVMTDSARVEEVVKSFEAWVSLS